ncbi:MAG: glycosyltransferase family 4 protein [Candidatus Glassbacteria bacterium]
MKPKRHESKTVQSDLKFKVAMDVSSACETLVGGVGYSTAHISHEMKKILGDGNIRFLSHLGSFQEVSAEATFPLSLSGPRWKLNRAYRHLYREYILPRQIKEFGAKVAHFPDSKVPRGMRDDSTGIVVTVNDMGAYVGMVPEEHTLRHRKTIAEGVKAADIIITISDFTKGSLIEILDVDPAKIRTVYLGVSSRFRPLEQEVSIRTFLERYNVKEGYFFFVGEVNRRKNLLSLTEAHRLLPAPLRKMHPLVITGRINRRAMGSDKAFLEDFLSLIDEHIILTGVVSEQDKLFLYNGCLAFVFPSTYEGFGLPVLEAMACGKAVIAADCSAIRELHSGKALLLEEATGEVIRKAMVRIIEDDALRRRLEAKGRRHAASFTWRNTAINTIRAYKDAVRS